MLSHPGGNQVVRALLTGLVKENLLLEFYTTLAANPTAYWAKFLPGKFRSEWLRRAYPISAEYIRTRPFLELSRLIFSRIGFKQAVLPEYGWASVDAVYKDLDRSMAKRIAQINNIKEVEAIYAYEDGALASFTAAKSRGLKCVYDLPIAYWETGRKLMLEEAERLPDWAKTLGGGIQDSKTKLDRKVRELELADTVVVPSQFVMDSLPTWAKEKKIVNTPFGSPKIKQAIEISEIEVAPDFNRPLRILFVGSMSQRKGLGDLFTAIRLLNRTDIELVVLGNLMESMAFYRSRLPNFTYELNRPHEQVLKLMRSCDVFCLPSIVEGRALVMQEAMIQGLPLIITPNTGGADLIEEGKTGFLVPIRSPEIIAKRLEWFLNNRSELPRMRKLAQDHASLYTWENYASQIIKCFDSTN